MGGPRPGVSQAAFTVEVDGQPLRATSGQTVAAVLVAAGRLAWNRAPSGAPRGVFCGMGLCYECAVTIDGLPDQRACLTPAEPGMLVTTNLK